MKKIISIIGLITIVNVSLAQIVFQSNLQNWSGGLPTDWTGTGSTIANANVSQVFIGSTFGTYMAALHNSTTAGLGLASNNVTVIAGAKYKLEIFVKSNMGDMAIGYYDVTNSAYGPISAYRNVASSGSITVIDSITVPATCTNIQFMVYAKNTAAIGIGNIGVNLDRVVVSFLSGPPLPSVSPYTPRTIYEIQHTTSASGDSPYKDSLVEATGIVTGTLSNGYFIQDSAKSWNGIYVFDNINTPSRGDKITVRAKVNEYFYLTQLKSVDTMILVSAGNALPVPIGINTTELSTEEKYEGVLCKVSAGLCVNASAGNGEWYFINISDTGVVDDLMYAFVPTLAQKYDVTGVVYYSFGEYKIEPRDSNDVFINTTLINENENELDFSIYPNPVNSIVTISGLNLEKAEIYSVNGKLIKKVSLSVLSTINVTDLEKGIYIIKVITNTKVGISRFVKQ